MALSLLALGATSADRVMLFADNCIEFVITLVATIYLGLAFVLIEPVAGPYILWHRITNADVTILVYGENKRSVVKKAFANDDYSPELQSRLKMLLQIGDDQVEDDAPQITLQEMMEDLVIDD